MTGQWSKARQRKAKPLDFYRRCQSHISHNLAKITFGQCAWNYNPEQALEICQYEPDGRIRGECLKEVNELLSRYHDRVRKTKDKSIPIRDRVAMYDVDPDTIPEACYSEFLKIKIPYFQSQHFVAADQVSQCVLKEVFRSGEKKWCQHLSSSTNHQCCMHIAHPDTQKCQIGDIKKVEECWLKLAQEKLDSNYCSWMSKRHLKESCQYSLGHCAIPTAGQNHDCRDRVISKFVEKGIAKKSLSVCDRLDFMLKKECRILIFKRTQDLRLCLEDYQLERDPECFKGLKGTLELCQKHYQPKGSTLYNRCLYAVGACDHLVQDPSDPLIKQNYMLAMKKRMHRNEVRGPNSRANLPREEPKIVNISEFRKKECQEYFRSNQ